MPARLFVLVLFAWSIAGCVSNEQRPPIDPPEFIDPFEYEPIGHPEASLPQDYNATYDEWVPGGSIGTSPYAASYPFPVEPSARKVVVTLETFSEYPMVGILPFPTNDATLEILGTGGESLASGNYRVASHDQPIVLEVEPRAFGEYKAAVTIAGGSDGQSMGDRFVLAIEVRYR